MMFVVDQNGNTLETFLIDENTGKLTKTEMLESGNNPTFVGLLWSCFIYNSLMYKNITNNNYFDIYGLIGVFFSFLDGYF